MSLGLFLIVRATVPFWSEIVNAAGGIGSLVSGLTAAVLLVMQRRTITREHAQRNREERQRQAIGVTWLTERRAAPDENSELRPFADAAHDAPGYVQNVILAVHNASDNCIYDCTVQTAPFDEPENAHLRHRQIGVLPPGVTRFKVPVPAVDRTPTMAARHRVDISYNVLVEWLEFRDVSQVVWRRYGDGRLESQPSRPRDTTTAHSI
jgi:heme exporter protein D